MYNPDIAPLVREYVDNRMAHAVQSNDRAFEYAKLIGNLQAWVAMLAEGSMSTRDLVRSIKTLEY